mmetsp:Transcript_55942/g.100555  ORF Transcript_55942/g.100555 Transcript_55942/m.100555 type:complete len:154 (-) Transcript_55942:1216-1677(-)
MKVQPSTKRQSESKGGKTHTHMHRSESKAFQSDPPTPTDKKSKQPLAWLHLLSRHSPDRKALLAYWKCCTLTRPVLEQTSLCRSGETTKRRYNNNNNNNNISNNNICEIFSSLQLWLGRVLSEKVRFPVPVPRRSARDRVGEPDMESSSQPSE